MKKFYTGLILAMCVLLASASVAFAKGSYVGSKKCADCHDEQYEKFHKYSKKSHSWKSIQVMASDLKPAEQQECYTCHTTGYGDGGFVNYETTPHLSDVGCETCHGPGAAHAESEDPEDITLVPEIESCEKCHSSDRIQSFNYKPLIYSGAH